MPKYGQYYIIEYRYAIRIDDAASVVEAVSISNRICEKEFGFKPENWHARIFEYSTQSKDPGVVKEYFYNPYSASHREITKNISYHSDLIASGDIPQDLMEENNKLLNEDIDIKD
jgi:hypothetical protein